MERIDKLMYHAILLFVIGGLFGYFFETLQQLFKTGKIINRQGLWFSVFNQFMELDLFYLLFYYLN